MKNKLPVLSFIVLSAISLLMAGCYYDNEEYLYPGITSCDTSNVTFSGTVAPILVANCNSCHSTTAPSGGVVTDNITGVKANITRIWGSINHTGTYSYMPQNLPKLSDCDLTKIGIWKDAGMPDN